MSLEVSLTLDHYNVNVLPDDFGLNQGGQEVNHNTGQAREAPSRRREVPKC